MRQEAEERRLNPLAPTNFIANKKAVSAGYGLFVFIPPKKNIPAVAHLFTNP
ncbi:MAG: hypothetical protein AAB356_00885 [Deltaproteobacteria bacterium]